MSKISAAKYRKMKNAYRHDVARFLASQAIVGKFTTYGELAEKYGGVARGWGDALGGIAIRCRENSLPILTMIVVNASNNMPSTDAVLYEDFGFTSEDLVREEQTKCFAFDWSKTPLGR
jgi:hypothetical protein